MYVVYMSAVPTEARRGHLVPLELELQVAVSHSVWMLGRELVSSGRAVPVVKCSLAPSVPAFKTVSSLRSRRPWIWSLDSIKCGLLFVSCGPL